MKVKNAEEASKQANETISEAKKQARNTVRDARKQARRQLLRARIAAARTRAGAQTKASRVSAKAVGAAGVVGLVAGYLLDRKVRSRRDAEYGTGHVDQTAEAVNGQSDAEKETLVGAQ